ncbi:thymidylate kinase [Paeniglutamicibacter sp. ABSL32-1]|uniref:dTMP kinase n=1 Tax=Paeniglutamicibacter quisquiliarum TaxID=2849498 RepID=UPI001C2CF751|nr:dTMP kinase [Paeniglutamicibacter quisquiliarum]MBV1779299.1 thymidylate kinase [Paeniglutamicibacter quisquiliarum]
MSPATTTTTDTLPNPRHADAHANERSRPRTVVLLGIDGAGKTTVGTTLAAELQASGTQAQLLRNPAGRRWMSRVAGRFGTALTPAWADRLESVVRLANVLASHARASGFAGTTVMDRHVACQLVLRSVRGLPQGVLLPWLLSRLPEPDAVILIDVPAEVAHARILARGEDSETLSYLRSAREAYLEIALARGWHIIDGTGTPRQVAAKTRRAATGND